MPIQRSNALDDLLAAAVILLSLAITAVALSISFN